MSRQPAFYAALLVAFFFFWAEADAEVSGQLDFSSRYIWRGWDLNPPKKPVIQPSVDIPFGETGLSINLWSSISFVSEELDEFDLTLTYSTRLSEDVFLEAGLIHYGWYLADYFSFKENTSHEVYSALGLPNLFLSPILSVYYDFAAGNGFYVQLEIGHSFPFSQSFGADLSASVGYNGGQWLAEGDDPGFSDINFGLALPFETGRFQFTAFANCTIVLLDAIGKENHFWFGLSFNYTTGKKGTIQKKASPFP